MSEKRLTWKKFQETVYHAFNKDGFDLGYLWYEKIGAHMHWCWYQAQEIRMSPGCLQEVRDKQKELLNLRNKKH